jgi:hypothetical protein
MSGVTLTSPIPVTQIPEFCCEIKLLVEVVREAGGEKLSQPLMARMVTVNIIRIARDNMRFISTTLTKPSMIRVYPKLSMKSRRVFLLFFFPI